MSIVAIGRNGIGLGHLSRTVAVCEALSGVGFRPLIFTSDTAGALIPHTLPATLIHGLGTLTRPDLREFQRRVESAALMSEPSVVIEDTHPIGITLSSAIARFLIVRPLTFSALLNLKHVNQSEYSHFFIADDPGSPTWPYDSDETFQIQGWDKWTCVGPIYRRAQSRDITEVRRRYSWSPDRRICVFSLGGGGEHVGADDATEFLRKAEEIARKIRTIDRKAQLIFVRGPLFSTRRGVGDIFEDVPFEPLMPALFAISDLACIRPGFNSTWECLVEGTPIVPVVGTSYQEPIAARLQRLKQLGFLVSDVEAVWTARKRGGRSKPGAEGAATLPGNHIDAIATAIQRLPKRSPSVHRQWTGTDLRVLICLHGAGGDLRARWPNEVVDTLVAEELDVALCVGALNELVKPVQAREVTVLACGYEHDSAAGGCQALRFFDPSVVVCCGSPFERVTHAKAGGPFHLAMTAHQSEADDGVVFRKVPDEPAGAIAGELRLSANVRATSDAAESPSFAASKIAWLARTQLKSAGFWTGFTMRKSFFIRIDDVVALDDALGSALEVAAAHQTAVSLEVIPYLCTFTSSDLDVIAPASALLEIGQHGYSHLPRSPLTLTSAKSEFDTAKVRPSEWEIADIARGQTDLKRRFPSYFSGGFSPPFDGMPLWLGEAWEQLGGRFISVMGNLPPRGRIPTVRAAIDTWHWQCDFRRSDASIWLDIGMSLARTGYAGIVVHKQHLQTPADIKWMKRLLSDLLDEGFISVRMSDLAAMQSENIAACNGRAYESLHKRRD